MAQEQGRKHHIDPDPPLTPEFPRLQHPDLEPGQTEDVPAKPPNSGEVRQQPESEDVPAGNPTPEPPD
ncbi:MULTISPECIES: hypothetical protein [Amycolatopsis]|uniref:Uncharacterized protein n=2 Tax=Amycolatopsis TaxID=1813 RepID=A0A1I4D4E0_9PSEU|nr:hypothetical protein [Amycolatopsis sacchari]SFK86891.1 hypothetical protein SAMN05421835_13949 [Amycolatopsis sacchari]